MKKLIKFAALRRLLTELGCSEELVRDSFYLFTHPDGGKFGFRLYKPNEYVTPADLFSLRWHLDQWGLVEQDQFEQWLQGIAV